MPQGPLRIRPIWHRCCCCCRLSADMLGQADSRKITGQSLEAVVVVTLPSPRFVRWHTETVLLKWQNCVPEFKEGCSAPEAFYCEGGLRSSAVWLATFSHSFLAWKPIEYISCVKTRGRIAWNWQSDNAHNVCFKNDLGFQLHHLC